MDHFSKLFKFDDDRHHVSRVEIVIVPTDAFFFLLEIVLRIPLHRPFLKRSKNEMKEIQTSALNEELVFLIFINQFSFHFVTFSTFRVHSRDHQKDAIELPGALVLLF
jgi:hypothetical protein